MGLTAGTAALESRATWTGCAAAVMEKPHAEQACTVQGLRGCEAQQQPRKQSAKRGVETLHGIARLSGCARDWAGGRHGGRAAMGTG